MCANWVDNSDMSPPDDNGQYQFDHQLDNVGLQLGLGLPIQLLGVSMMNNPPPVRHYGNRCRGGFRRNQHRRNSNQREKKLEVQQTCDGIPIRKIYINNIPIEIQRADLQHVFGKFGKIYQIFMGVSKDDYNKQFAFITYIDPLDAARVLKNPWTITLRGRKIFANAADSWHQPLELPDGTIDWRSRKTPTREEGSSEQSEDQSSEETTGGLVETEINEGSLNKLNDDCLLHVFSFLSFKEITAVERVCKRWQALSFQMWYCLHELNFCEDSEFAKTSCDTKVLAQYLKRCGSSLTKLYLTNVNHDFSDSTLAVVAKHCENLEVLSVNDIPIAPRSLAHLGRSCPRLKHISLDDCESISDEDLNSLLRKCDDLRVLELANLHRVCGKCLAKVQGPVSKLRLSDLPRVDPEFVISGLQKMSPSLESVELNGCSLLQSHNVMSKIVAAVPNITSFNLSHWMMNYNSQFLTPLGQLKKLSSLDLSENTEVDDSSLAVIVDGCENLTTLNVSGGFGCAYTLSETGISMLARLRKLTHLNISYLDAANNTALKNFTAKNCKLKILECRSCPGLSDDGAETVVTMCNELELFDLSGCGEITNKTVETAVTSVKMRTNNIPLRIVVGGTQATTTVYKDVPLITVDYIYSVEKDGRPCILDDIFFHPSDSDEDLNDDLEHLSFMFNVHEILNDLTDSEDYSSDEFLSDFEFL